MYSLFCSLFLTENTKPLKAGRSVTTMINSEKQVYVLGNLLGHSYFKAYLIDGLPRIKQVEHGGEHTLFLSYEGEVYSCGRGDKGQLGTGSTIGLVPEKLALPPIKSVSCGPFNSSFLTEDGQVYLCGSGREGQLGGRNSEFLPVLIKLPPVKQVCFGVDNTIFLTESGDIYTCGNDEYIRGVGRRKDQKPVKTWREELRSIKQIATGGQHTAFLKEDGTVHVFGDFRDDRDGRVFYFSFHDYDFTRLTDVVEVSCGFNHIAFLTSSGEVYTCGSNTKGQLGNNAEIGFISKVDNIPSIRQLSCGFNHTVLLSEMGEVFGFGDSSNGELGIDIIRTPTLISKKVDRVICGMRSAVVVKSGKLQVIDSNGSLTLSGPPVFAVDTCDKYGYHFLFIDDKGTAWGFGENNHGQLGLGYSRKTISIPEPVILPKIVIQVSCDIGHSGFLLESGEVYMSGRGDSGQLGTGRDGRDYKEEIPVSISINEPVVQISCGAEFTLFLTTTGKVYKCGEGKSTIPVEIRFSEPIQRIASGSDHSSFLGQDGRVFMMGDNENGKLGTGDRVDRDNPVVIRELPVIKQVSCGIDHSVFLSMDGLVYVSGLGLEGILGTGKLADELSPVLVRNLPRIKQVSAGAFITTFLAWNGDLFMSGSVSDAGFGTLDLSRTPLRVYFNDESFSP
jgi:alpha-tubulin suppressor-like RCC1 family protein